MERGNLAELKLVLIKCKTQCDLQTKQHDDTKFKDSWLPLKAMVKKKKIFLKKPLSEVVTSIHPVLLPADEDADGDDQYQRE